MKTHLFTPLCLALLSFASFQVAHAAGITFGSFQGITGDSDISLDGTYVDAVGDLSNGGVTVDDNGTDIIFNGVTGGSGSYSDGANISFSIEGIGGDQPYGHSSDIPSDYYDALTGVAYVGDGGTPVTGTVDLSNLTPTDEYEVEVWQALPEGDDGNSDTTYTSLGGNSVTSAGYDYVIGTFDAASTSQTFTFTAGTLGVGEINAIQLRDLGPAVVPEPGTVALLVAGVVGLLLVYRRRAVLAD